MISRPCPVKDEIIACMKMGVRNITTIARLTGSAKSYVEKVVHDYENRGKPKKLASQEKMTDAICPGCRKEDGYQVRMHWTGNGKPRVFCDKCKWQQRVYNCAEGCGE